MTNSALRDLQGIDDYWTNREEPDRGEKYVRDLFHAAQTLLCDPESARRGRPVRGALLPGTRFIPVFKSSYRIIYRIEEGEAIVYVLSFRHSHRDEPGALI